MDAFEQITTNPAFCRHVTEVVYDGRLFHKHFLKPKTYHTAYQSYVLEQPEEWREAILADCKRAEKEIRRKKNGIRGAGSELTEGEKIALKAVRERTYNGRLRKSMKEYMKFYIEQERILDNCRDKDVLFAGMKQMPNIYRLSIINQFGKSDDRSSMEHSWYDKMTTRSFGCSLTPTQWPKRYLISSDMVTVEDARLSGRPWDCRSIVNILQAAAMHNLGIEGFELGSARSKAPIGIFSNNSTTVLEQHKASLRDLRISGAYITPQQGTWKDVAHRLGQSLELRNLGLCRIIDTSEPGHDMYYSGGYSMLAIPSFSPEHYDIYESMDFVEVWQKRTGPDHW